MTELVLAVSEDTSWALQAVSSLHARQPVKSSAEQSRFQAVAGSDRLGRSAVTGLRVSPYRKRRALFCICDPGLLYF